MRYTVTSLRNDIDNLNTELAEIGSKKRLETVGRYNYRELIYTVNQAVDIYSVDDSGQRVGSGVDRNLETGTSRECHAASVQFVKNEYRAKLVN